MNQLNPHNVRGATMRLSLFATIAVALLSLGSASVQAQSRADRAHEQIAEINHRISDLETQLSDAEAALDRAQSASYAAARAVRAWRDSKKSERRVEDLERLTDAHAAVIEKEKAARAERDATRQALAETETARDELAKQHRADFADRLPPHLEQVKVYSGSRLVYHGVWEPKSDDLMRRIAVHEAILEGLPAVQDAQLRDLNAAIDKAVAAIAASDAALKRYVVAVDVEAKRRRALNLADIGQTMLRDTATGGYVGLAISSVNELVKAHRPGGSIDADREYWNVNRLPGLSAATQHSVDTADRLRLLGVQRAYVQELEAAQKPVPGGELDSAAVAKAAKQAVLEPGDTMADVLLPYAEAYLTDSAKEVTKIAARQGLERFGNRDNAAVRRALTDLSGGRFENRAAGFVSAMGRVHESFAGGVAIDAAIAGIKDEALKALTKQRINVYREYVGTWVEQVWLENEVVSISQDYWTTRRAAVEAQRQIKNLKRILNGEIDGRRVLKPAVDRILSGEGTFRLELLFSEQVDVDSVTIDDTVVTGRRVAPLQWVGTFRLDGLRETPTLHVSAHDALTGHILANPHSAPYWTDDGRLEGYFPVIDHYHHLRVLAPDPSDSVSRDGGARPAQSAGASGITVSVADVFGPEGFRKQPTPGVGVIVLDTRGGTVARTTMGKKIAGDFVALSPGSYVLRLDVGKYEPALPRHCTDGYVRAFELTPGEKLSFAASVYTTRVADDGRSIGTVSGDCITLR